MLFNSVRDALRKLDEGQDFLQKGAVQTALFFYINVKNHVN